METGFLNTLDVFIFLKLYWGFFLNVKNTLNLKKEEEKKRALKIACFGLVEIYCLPASDMVFTSSHIQPCTVFQNCHLVI